MNLYNDDVLRVQICKYFYTKKLLWGVLGCWSSTGKTICVQI